MTSGVFAQNASGQNLQSITASGTAQSFAGDPSSGNPIFEPGTGHEESTVTITLTGGDCPTVKRSSPVDVVLVIDVSNSMQEPSGNMSRIDAVKIAATQFLTYFNLKPNDPIGSDQIAVVRFSDSAFVQQAFSRNVSDLRTAIDNLSINGGTNIADGLNSATDLLRGAPDVTGGPNSAAAPVIVLLTDAAQLSSFDGGAALDAANRARINLPGLRIVTIAFGPDADTNLMQSIANDPASDNSFHATSPDELVNSYSRIASLVQPKIAGQGLNLTYTVNSSFDLIPDKYSRRRLPAPPMGRSSGRDSAI